MTKANADFVKKNFANVKAGYEADGPDCTVPGACRGPARYALVTESLRGHGYFVNWCEDLQGVERAAASNIDEGWQPVCYFDLFEMQGGELPPMEGDLVEYDGRHLYVTHANEDVAEGEMFTKVWLDTNPDAFIDAEYQEVDETDVRIIERAEPDERMPVRYMVAKIITQVVFNTIPQPV